MNRQEIIVGQASASDCQIKATRTDSGGRDIQLRSKVQVLFGQAILNQVQTVLETYGIRDIRLEIQDEGALDWVISARCDAAIRGIFPELSPLPLQSSRFPFSASSKDGLRRSRLYLPGNSPKLMLNAAKHRPDGIILDLEDAVAPSAKEEARYLVRNALLSLDFMGAEKMVRINQLPLGLQDLDYVIPAGAQLVLLPKCESAEQVRTLDARIQNILENSPRPGPVWIMPIIESALGVVKAYEIASASPHVVSMAIGLEDYTADLGTLRTEGGQESLFARMTLVNASKAAGIQAIDSVFSDVGDMDALARNVKQSKALGFDGMGCIHPRQIRVIHDGYAPELKEVEKAKAIAIAMEEARAKGLGVVTIGSKMIDAPVAKRALRTLDLAIRTGLLAADWKENQK